MNIATTEATANPVATETPAAPQKAEPTRVPQVDVVETPDAFVVRADVPGVSMDAVDVTLEAESLEITADRTGTDRENHRAVVRQFREGPYRRRFRVPREIARDEIRAELRDGVLCVTLPKASPDRARKVEVRAG